MGPAKLSIRGPGAGRESIGDDHPIAAGVLAQQGLQGVMTWAAMHSEGVGPGGQPDPESVLPAGLTPAGLVDVDRLGLADGLDDLGHRVGQNLADLTLELGDHAGGDRDAQQVGEEPLDLAFVRAIGPAQESGPGLESRPEGPAWDVAGELGAGGGPAPRAGQAVEAILDDFGSDLGEFGDLMTQGLRVVSVEGLAAAGAGRRLDLDGAGQPLGGHQLAEMTLVPELTAPSLLGGRPGRLPLGVEGLNRWGLGRVGRVPVEPGLEGGDPLLEALERPPGHPAVSWPADHHEMGACCSCPRLSPRPAKSATTYSVNGFPGVSLHHLAGPARAPLARRK